MEGHLQIILSVVPAIATAVFGWIFYKIKKRDEEKEISERERKEELLDRERAINNALRALCRDRIIQGYRYYRKGKGISPADLETMMKLYNAYHGLGGNGTITAIYEKICDLPIKGDAA